MAPDRIQNKTLRGFVFGLIGALAVMTAILSVVTVVLYGRLDTAQRRIAGLESAGKTAEVATCYSQARGRPALIIILRGIATKLDPDPRDATNDFIDRYQAQTPTVHQCDMLAVRRGLDPKNFPAPNVTRGGG